MIAVSLVSEYLALRQIIREACEVDGETDAEKPLELERQDERAEIQRAYHDPELWR